MLRVALSYVFEVHALKAACLELAVRCATGQNSHLHVLAAAIVVYITIHRRTLLSLVVAVLAAAAAVAVVVV
jgi:hypothetical protein